MQCLKWRPLESEEISADANPLYRGMISLGLSEGHSVSTTYLCCLQRYFKRSFPIMWRESQFLFLWQTTQEEQLEERKANLGSVSRCFSQCPLTCLCGSWWDRASCQGACGTEKLTHIMSERVDEAREKKGREVGGRGWQGGREGGRDKILPSGFAAKTTPINQIPTPQFLSPPQ